MENTKDKDFAVIPYFIHEGMMTRNERTIKRLIIAVIIAVVLVAASNGAWLWAWLQYDYVSEDTTIESEDNGIATYNYTGGNGGVIYGENYSPQADTGEN